MTAKSKTPQRSGLEDAVQRAVDGRQGFLDWPAVLRRAYFAHHREGTRRELRNLQLIGLAIAVCTVLLDAITLPTDALWRGIGLRAALVVAPGLIVLALWNHLKTRTLKLAVAGNLVVFAGIVAHLATFGDAATATRHTMALGLMLAMGIVLLPLMREELVAFGAGFVGSTLMSAMWPRTLESSILLQHMIMILIIFIAGLTVAIRHRAERDRNFLYDLRDSFVHAELEQNIRVLRELSESDSLTGIANRRSFNSSFEAIFADANRPDKRGVTVMMIDIDDFKQFNDEHGHQAGDRALRAVGRCLEAGFRDVDGIVARFGGEEFIAAFSSASIAEAEHIATDVCSAIRALRIGVRESGKGEKITASIGVASTGAGAEVDLGQLTARADRALYHAKGEGRDRVTVSETIELRVDRLAG